MCCEPSGAAVVVVAMAGTACWQYDGGNTSPAGLGEALTASRESRQARGRLGVWKTSAPTNTGQKPLC